MTLSSYILSLQGKVIDKYSRVIYKNNNRLDFRRENLDIGSKEEYPIVRGRTGHKGIVYIEREIKSTKHTLVLTALT
jgi:hypothetical protein